MPPKKETENSFPSSSERKIRAQKKGEQLPQVKLEKPGDEASGYFQGFKIAMLDDEKAGKKPVRYYEFVDVIDPKKRFVVSGRLMLDMAYDDVLRDIQETDPDFHMEGELITLRRLDTTKLKGGRTLGNYEVIVYESERDE